MEVGLTELLNLVPGLVYAVFVVLIYRDGLRQINDREAMLHTRHKEELDRLSESYIARVEGLQTALDKLLSKIGD